MVKNIKTRPHQKPPPQKAHGNKPEPARPIWQNPFLWLVLVPTLLYAKIILFDFTALDDQFFVIEHAAFNENLGNLLNVFSQGLFVPKNDVYYRPVFLIDMILEYQLFGIKPWGYHLVSLIFHLASVCLLFVFLKKVKIPETPSFVLALLFSIHPVLTQTVAWIPGRNDLILMIFFLSTLICIIDYFRTSNIILFFAQFITFLLAMLTKETAVIIPVIAVLLMRFVFSVKLSKMLPMFASWAVGLLVWYALRASSDPAYQGVLYLDMFQSGLTRIPALLQYLGKIFFPVNLSAVPQFEDITLIWGSVSLVLLIALIAISKSYKKPLVIIGLLWYFLFLLPVLLVPKQLNDQLYEHRLYLPFIGILLILSQTLLFSEKWTKKHILIVSSGIFLVLMAVSFIRLDCYRDRHTFWEKAVADSPKSAFAKMNQGIQSQDSVLREKYIRHAYAMDPQEMLVNYWMGITMQRKNKIDSAAYFYKKELTNANFPDLYFNLSRCLFELNKLDSSAWYLSKGIELDPTKTAAITFLANVYFRLAESAYQRAKYDSAVHYLRQVTTFDPKSEQANHNLAMVYFLTNQRAKGLQVMESMRMSGITVSDDLINLAK
jgi:tetratricopeptide (TPR) repeat protein